MAATDNSTVKITINLVDANSGAVVGQVTKNLGGMGAAGKRAGDEIAAGMAKASESVRSVGAPALRWSKQLGDEGQKAGQAIAAGMDHAGSHTLSSLDKVRLLRDDLGIRLPRAMESAISKSDLLMQGISAAGTGMLALGAIEVFARIGTQVYGLYKNLTDVNSELQKYAVNAASAAQGKLFDTASIGSARSCVKQTQGDIDQINADRQNAGVGMDGKGSAKQYGRYYAQGAEHGLSVGYNAMIDAVAPDALKGTPFDMAAGMKVPEVAAPTIYHKHNEQELIGAMDRNDAAKDRLRAQQQSLALEKQQGDATARTTALTGAAARASQERAAVDEAALKRQQARDNEQYLYQKSVEARKLAKDSGKPMNALYTPDPNAGEAEYQQALSAARQKSAAESSAEGRKEREETLRMQAEAHKAELQGEAAFAAQRDEQIRQINAQAGNTDIQSMKEAQDRVKAVRDQYMAERKKRLEAEHEETARMQAEAQAGGQQGLARMDAEHTARTAAITKQAPGFSDSVTAAQRQAAEDTRYRQEQQHETEQFTDRIRSMDDDRANSSMSANARVDAETRRTVNEIRKAWQDLYGQLGPMDQRRVQSYAALQGEIVRIEAAGTAEKVRNRQELEDQTTKAEAEGARSGMTREVEARKAIIDSYNERYRQLEELRARDADNADLYRRQEVAAEAEKNGKLLQQQRELRDKLAGTLRGLMDNPLQALRKLGEDAASKYAADLILKHSNLPGGVPGGDPGVGGSRGIGTVLDLPFPGLGRKRSGDAGSEHGPQRPDSSHVATSATVSAASTVLNAGSAEIHIAQATFASMPGGSGGAVPAVAALQAAGSSNAGSIAAARAAFGGTRSSVPEAVSGLPPSITGMMSTAELGRAIQSGGASSSTSSVGSAMNMAQSTAELGKSLMGPDGMFATKLPAATLAKSSDMLGKAGGAIGAGSGLFSAATSNGGFGSAVSGTMSGMQLGGLIGGPMGSAIGAAAGAVLGFLGLGGASRAKSYFTMQVKPRIANDVTGFGMGSMTYQEAYDDLVSLDKEARQQTKQFGMGGKREWDSDIHPAIINAQSQLTKEQKAGRSKYGMTAAEYHGGGVINGFGDFGTGANEGWIHAQRGETVMHQSATSMHGDALSLMLAGASRGQMAAYYGADAGTIGGRSSAPVNLNFHSHDAQGAYDLFMQNKHVIRDALNQSYAENSGGSDLG